MNREPDPTHAFDASAASTTCERAAILSVELLYGEAEAGARAELDAHLARCARCAAAESARGAAHAALANTSATLVLAATAAPMATPLQRSQPSRTDRLRRARRRAWRAVAAALLVLGVGGALHALESARRAELASAQRRELAGLAERLERALLQRDELWREALLVAQQSNAALVHDELRSRDGAQHEALARLHLEQVVENARLRAAIADLAAFAGYGRVGD
ncbi:MAG: hypothetical protein IPN34_14290 [Planctomycetes bacterium]|nr:hypothetical protein [Planctomycetota bacterium]